MYIYQLKLRGKIIPGYHMDDTGSIRNDGSNRIVERRMNFKVNAFVVRLIVDGVEKCIRLDLLVLSTFDRYYEDLVRIHHLDGNPMNCHPDNLVGIRKADMLKMYKDMYQLDQFQEIGEEWKPVPYIPNVEVSNLGNVRHIDDHSDVFTREDHGYYLIYYPMPDGKRHHFIHRLVAEQFVENPNPDTFKYVNHIDGDKGNNVFFNLEWCDASMNTKHAGQMGLLGFRYSEETIRNVCRLLEQGLPHTEISMITGMSRKYISDIYRGAKNKKISQEYNIVRVKNDEKYHRDEMIALIKKGLKGKEISQKFNLPYNQSFISYYERIHKNLMQGKIS